MKPPPPMLPATGNVTASAKPVATAASTALPPAFITSTPACAAFTSAATTIPFSARTGGGVAETWARAPLAPEARRRSARARRASIGMAVGCPNLLSLWRRRARGA